MSNTKAVAFKKANFRLSYFEFILKYFESIIYNVDILKPTLLKQDIPLNTNPDCDTLWSLASLILSGKSSKLPSKSDLKTKDHSIIYKKQSTGNVLILNNS